MSHTYSQPEEIDFVLIMEMAKNSEEARMPASHEVRFDEASWSGSHVLPSLAALMKTMDVQSVSTTQH